MANRTILSVRHGDAIPLHYAKKDPSTGAFYDATAITAVVATVRRIDGTLLATVPLVYDGALRGYKAAWAPGATLDGLPGAIVFLDPTRAPGVPPALTPTDVVQLDLSDTTQRLDEVEAIVTQLRKALTNRLDTVGGNPGKLLLYDDDGATILMSWDLTDEAGGAVLTTVGTPARRSAGT